MVRELRGESASDGNGVHLNHTPLVGMAFCGLPAIGSRTENAGEDHPSEYGRHAVQS